MVKEIRNFFGEPVRIGHRRHRDLDGLLANLLGARLGPAAIRLAV